MENRLRLKTPQDLLAIVPHLLGFQPERSLVLIAISGPSRQIAFCARVDLPDPQDRISSLQFAFEAAGTVQREGVDEVMIVLYDPDEPDMYERPGQDLADAAQHVLEELSDGPSLPVLEMLGVAEDRWWSYLCDDPLCCPLLGRPILDGSEPGGPSQVVAAAAVAGLGVLPDRETLVRSVQPRGSSDKQAKMARAIARAVPEQRNAAQTLRLLDQAIKQSQDPERRELTAAQAAELIAGLAHLPARDKVIVRGAAYLDDSPERLPPMLSVLTELTALAPPPAGAPIACILAMLAYSYGDGALATVATERALADDASYSCAQLLRQILAARLDPAEVRAFALASGQVVGNGSMPG